MDSSGPNASPATLERLSLNQRGQVIYTLKKPYSDGTTHIVMTQHRDLPPVRKQNDDHCRH